MKNLKPALLALGCALLIVMTNESTKSVIASNRQHHAEQQLREMAAGYELVTSDEGYRLVLAGKPVGRIAAASTMTGYNGRIDLLVALLDSGQIVKVRVTRHQETPGIGDAIELPVSNWILGLNGRQIEQAALAPEGDLDAITGATVTSRAVVNAVAGVATR